MRHSWELYTLGLELRFKSFPEQLPEYLETIRNHKGGYYSSFVAPVHSAFKQCELIREVHKFKILEGIIFYEKLKDFYYWFTVEKKKTNTGDSLFLAIHFEKLATELPANCKNNSFGLIPLSDPEFIGLDLKNVDLEQKNKLREDFFYRKNHSGRNEYYFKSPEECSIPKEKVEAALKEVDKISAQMKAPSPQPKPYVPPKKSLKERLNEFINDNLGLIFCGVAFLIFIVLPYIIISNVFPDGGHKHSSSYEYPEYELVRNAKR